jgi:hypothetical protein
MAADDQIDGAERLRAESIIERWLETTEDEKCQIMVEAVRPWSVSRGDHDLVERIDNDTRVQSWLRRNYRRA